MAEPMVKDRLLAAGVPEFYAQRAVDRGLTAEDIEWNARLGRPAQWKETVHPETERERRRDWQAAQDVRAAAQARVNAATAAATAAAPPPPPVP